MSGNLSLSQRNHEENVKILMDEISHPGFSVVIPLRECMTDTQTEKIKERLGEQEMAEKIDIILSGVGGQGVLSVGAIVFNGCNEGGA